MLSKLNELRKGREEGFTLIELLVVIGIIGVLAAVALPIFLNQQKAAIESSIQSDVRNTVTNAATYVAQTPGTLNFADVDVVKSGSNTVTVSAEAGVAGGYIVEGSNADIDKGTYTYTSSTGAYEWVA